jgi:hypothetical protein
MTDLMQRVCKCSPIARITHVLAAIYTHMLGTLELGGICSRVI